MINNLRLYLEIYFAINIFMFGYSVKYNEHETDSIKLYLCHFMIISCGLILLIYYLCQEMIVVLFYKLNKMFQIRLFYKIYFGNINITKEKLDKINHLNRTTKQNYFENLAVKKINKKYKIHTTH